MTTAIGRRSQADNSAGVVGWRIHPNAVASVTAAGWGETCLLTERLKGLLHGQAVSRTYQATGYLARTAKSMLPYRHAGGRSSGDGQGNS